MPKQDPATTKQFADLLSKALGSYKGEDPPPRDPVAQLIVGFLQWNATAAQAEEAFAALMDRMIDVNDLRVSHPHELVEVIGEDYPQASVRCIRLREALHEVYRREHDIHMHSISGKSKKEQRAYLDSLPGSTPYVAAQVTLLSFGGHAMPVDDKLCALLIQQDCLSADTTPADAESHLTRQVKAGDALEAHLALQAWADKKKMPAEAHLDSPTTHEPGSPGSQLPEAPVTPVPTVKKKTTAKKKSA